MTVRIFQIERQRTTKNRKRTSLFSEQGNRKSASGFKSAKSPARANGRAL
jgi:hypothetical protein